MLQNDSAMTIRSQDQIPTPPTAEGVVSAVRRILSIPDATILSINISEDRIAVDWEHVAGDTLDQPPSMSTASDVLDQMSLDEIEQMPSKAHTGTVFALERLRMSGVVPTHLIVNSVNDLRSVMRLGDMWSPQRGADASTQMWLGLVIVSEGTIRPNTMVFCGSPTGHGPLGECAYGVRLVIAADV